MSEPIKITASMVAALRAQTGAGMGDCKKALEEANGDAEAAATILRKKGMLKAEKRAGRAAAEGQIVAWVSDDATLGVAIELNSETDFVARNDEFVALSKLVAHHIGEDTSLDGVADITADHELMNRHWHHDKAQTLGEVVKAAAAKTGENVALRRVARFSSAKGAVGCYLHFNGKVAVLVEVVGVTGEAGRKCAYDVAEHLAAGVPTVAIAVSKADVPADVVEKERQFLIEQATAEGKPQAIAEKMVVGRLDKFFKEKVLLEQPWVRDDSMTIAQLVAKTPGASVVRFARFQMGEA
jgi:elongation factor Ts